jgi:hypothetical protein
MSAARSLSSADPRTPGARAGPRALGTGERRGGHCTRGVKRRPGVGTNDSTVPAWGKSYEG